jgi:hypothetical protein
MNEAPIVHVRILLGEVLLLVEHALEQDDLERASLWGALALSVNDPKEPADA